MKVYKSAVKDETGHSISTVTNGGNAGSAALTLTVQHRFGEKYG